MPNGNAEIFSSGEHKKVHTKRYAFIYCTEKFAMMYV